MDVDEEDLRDAGWLSFSFGNLNDDSSNGFERYSPQSFDMEKWPLPLIETRGLLSSAETSCNLKSPASTSPTAFGWFKQRNFSAAHVLQLCCLYSRAPLRQRWTAPMSHLQVVIIENYEIFSFLIHDQPPLNHRINHRETLTESLTLRKRDQISSKIIDATEWMALTHLSAR